MRRVILLCFLAGCAFDPDPFDLEETAPEDEAGGGPTAEAPAPNLPHDPRGVPPPETDPTEDPPGLGLPCEGDYETDEGHGNGHGGDGEESWDPCALYGLECRDGVCSYP